MENIDINTNNDSNNEIKIIKEDEIDFIALIKALWLDRKTIIRITVIVVIIGFLIAILSPVKYSARAVLILQSEESSPSLGGLGALAGLAGVNLSSMTGGNALTTDMYPDIVYSYPFLSELLKNSFYFEEESGNVVLYDKIFADNQKFINKLKNYTIRLPWTIKNKIFGAKPVQYKNDSDEKSNMIIMSYELDGVIKTLSKMIDVNVNIKTGLITIGATVKKNRVAAAQISQKVVDLLQMYIINFKTTQVQENLEFIEEQYLLKKSEFEANRKAFFDYRDSHRNMVPERTNIHYQELSDSYNMSMRLYTSLAEQYEQAKIAVRKETPVFTIIEPVIVPFEKSAPARTKIVILSGILGSFIGIAFTLSRLYLNRIKKEW